MDQQTPKQIIGRVEPVSFPSVGIGTVHARIDTGARTSAIWASSICEFDGRLEVIFFAPGHPEYTGEKIYFDEFTHGMVVSSNGQAEMRYKVRMLMTIAGRKIRARLTLADRSTQTYPVLVGRNVLRGKFIVDVKAGVPLIHAEKQSSQALQARLKRKADL